MADLENVGARAGGDDPVHARAGHRPESTTEPPPCASPPGPAASTTLAGALTDLFGSVAVAIVGLATSRHDPRARIHRTHADRQPTSTETVSAGCRTA